MLKKPLLPPQKKLDNLPFFVTKVVLSREQIESRIKELAAWVNKTYKDSNGLVIVAVLKGALVFMAQLIKDITVIHQIDFIVISSYKKTKSTRQPKIVLDLHSNIQNKSVLVVEDIIEKGITLRYVLKLLRLRKPKSIRVLSLLVKKSFDPGVPRPDAYGFLLKAGFLVGYGLDYEEKYRNLPYIAEFNTDYTNLKEVE